MINEQHLFSLLKATFEVYILQISFKISLCCLANIIGQHVCIYQTMNLCTSIIYSPSPKCVNLNETKCNLDKDNQSYFTTTVVRHLLIKYVGSSCYSLYHISTNNVQIQANNTIQLVPQQFQSLIKLILDILSANTCLIYNKF